MPNDTIPDIIDWLTGGHPLSFVIAFVIMSYLAYHYYLEPEEAGAYITLAVFGIIFVLASLIVKGIQPFIPFKLP